MMEFWRDKDMVIKQTENSTTQALTLPKLGLN